MTVTPSQLRANIYRLIDQVLETGVPLEIERNGRTVRLVPDRPSSWLDRLPKREAQLCSDEEIVHMDWSDSWSPGP